MALESPTLLMNMVLSRMRMLTEVVPERESSNRFSACICAVRVGGEEIVEICT